MLKEEEGQVYLFTKNNIKIDTKQIRPSIINHFKSIKKIKTAKASNLIGSFLF